MSKNNVRKPALANKPENLYVERAVNIKTNLDEVDQTLILATTWKATKNPTSNKLAVSPKYMA